MSPKFHIFVDVDEYSNDAKKLKIPSWRKKSWN